jgi:hypothetical protein
VKNPKLSLIDSNVFDNHNNNVALPKNDFAIMFSIKNPILTI